MWLRRIDQTVTADSVAEPYGLLFDGQFEAAAEAFHRLSTPYDAALALVESGDPQLARRALDVLDRRSADAVAAKVRADLRARGTLATRCRSSRQGSRHPLLAASIANAGLMRSATPLPLANAQHRLPWSGSTDGRVSSRQGASFILDSPNPGHSWG